MQRFVSRKVIKVPRYKILSLKIIGFTITIFIIYFSLSIYINKDSPKLLNIISRNSFGNNLNSPNIYNNKDLFFYQNSFGIIPNSTNASYNNNNIHNLIISQPLIYIYNTFQTSKYKSTNSHDYNVNSIVTSASLILSEYLKKEGIKSIVELENIEALVENKNYSDNYLASKELLTKAQKENPSLNYFLDLGISSASYNETTFKDQDKSYAKIRFIIGTNYASYESNLELATNINNKLTIENSNLSRGITLQGGKDTEGIYNQNLNPNIILVEIGGQENTIAEVNRTLKIFAHVLKEVINEKEKN